MQFRELKEATIQQLRLPLKQSNYLLSHHNYKVFDGLLVNVIYENFYCACAIILWIFD